MSALRWKTAQFFERLWWKRYLSNKPKHQYLQWKQAYWKNFSERLKKNIPKLFSDKKLQILDAGCGPAGIFTILQQHNVTAIDPLLHEYEKLPHFSKNDYPEIAFLQVALENFTAEKKFDIVFCLNAVNHVNDISLCIKNLCDSLKPDGYLVLSVDAHRYNLLQKIFRLVQGDILHPHQYSLDGYLQLLFSDKWQIVQTEKIKAGIIFNYVLITAKKV